MKIETKSLRSTVGRRIFLLFVVCGLAPILSLAFLSFRQVNGQLLSQTQQNLKRSSKASGMMIYRHLTIAEALMQELAAGVAEPERNGKSLFAGLEFELPNEFIGMVRLEASGRVQRLWGQLAGLPALDDAERVYLRSGGVLLSSSVVPGRPARVFMSRFVDAGHPDLGILIAALNVDRLTDERLLPIHDSLIVLNSNGALLVSAAEGGVKVSAQQVAGLGRRAARQFVWTRPGGNYLASAWTIFLKPQFFLSQWTVVVIEPESDALAPARNFRRRFILAVIISFLVVVLLSLIEIRRSMVPLEKLEAGTRLISQGYFGTHVDVHSGDEFEQLADAFNKMGRHLGRQFSALSAVNQIDRAILSSPDRERLAEAVLASLPGLVSSDALSITLVDAGDPSSTRTFVGSSVTDSSRSVYSLGLSGEELRWLEAHAEAFTVRASDLPLACLAPLSERGARFITVIPIKLNGEISAVICLGYSSENASPTEDMVQVRQVSSQVAVGLSAIRLFESLQNFSWGTLMALARAVDAKSPWTSGHSERVTKRAVGIGRELGLAERELEILHRGCLLHDIGKLGTPAALLDKQEKLEPAELKLMRDHVRTGARILEPIREYRDILPIVLGHHEWFDGSGYPSGLSGTGIHLYARILAVADVFDALNSSRPYRSGWPRQKAIDYIRSHSGTQFDPEIVEAFLKLMEKEETVEADESNSLVLETT